MSSLIYVLHCFVSTGLLLLGLALIADGLGRGVGLKHPDAHHRP
jgi:Na+/phosphate symporter